MASTSGANANGHSGTPPRRTFGTASVNSTASASSNGLRSSTASAPPRHNKGQSSVGSAPTSWQGIDRPGLPKSSSNGSMAPHTSHGTPAVGSPDPATESTSRPGMQRQRSVSSASGAAVERASNWLQALAPRGEGRSREFLTSTLSGVATVASTAAQEVNGFIRDRGSRPNSLVATSPPPVGSVGSPPPFGQPVRRAAAPANAARLPKAGTPPPSNRPSSVHLPLTSSPVASPTQRSFQQIPPIPTSYVARERGHQRAGSAASASNLSHSQSHPHPPHHAQSQPQLQQPQPHQAQSHTPQRVFTTPSPSHSPAPSRTPNQGLHASTNSSSSKLAVSASSSTHTPSPSLTASRTRGQPYKIGFQPSGVRSDRTAVFLRERKDKAGEREKEEGRLGRRWAKLVDLHFNPSLASRAMSAPSAPDRKSPFDGAFDSLNPKEVWRGLKAAAGPNADEARKRAVEQSIVKWEPDNDVKKCRICQTSFSLSNRKHHCRLCGRIVCSLPPTPPGLLGIQFELFGGDMEHLPAGFRRERCSLLLVADWKTGRGEEVEEGFVGWMSLEAEEGTEREQTFAKRHVRQTSAASTVSPAGSAPGSGASTPLPQQPQEVQVKGIRVCRECWRIVSRKQIIADALKPTRFARLYEALKLVQGEIDGILPDLDSGIRHADALLESGDWDRIDLSDLLENHKTLVSLLAEYDTVTKQLAAVQFGPPPSAVEPPKDQGKQKGEKEVGAVLLEGAGKDAPSTKQAEEVKGTIVRIASIYLAKCMAQVQNVAKLQRRILQKQSKGLVVHSVPAPEEELARELQPLLEQQAQLESFIAQANAQRKYDDSKALSTALAEIEREIQRLTSMAI